MIDIDRKDKTILLAALQDEDGKEVAPERSIAYDTLVVAIGSTSMILAL